MSRYFFHTADGSRQRDTEGLELPNVDIARNEAVKFAGALVNEEPGLVWHGGEFRVEVTDINKRLLLTVLILAVEAPALN